MITLLSFVTLVRVALCGVLEVSDAILVVRGPVLPAVPVGLTEDASVYLGLLVVP